MSMTSTDVTPVRVTSAKIVRILAMAIGTLVVVQFMLAGFGAFDAFQGEHGYEPHKVLGYVIGAATVVLLVVVFVARPNNRVIIQASVLFILAAPVQPLLAEAAKHQAWVGVFHVLVGVAILGSCFGLSMRSTTVFGTPLRRGGSGAGHPTSAVRTPEQP